MHDLDAGKKCVMQYFCVVLRRKTVGRKVGEHAIKSHAGAHLQTPWIFEAAKRLDDRVDYCLNAGRI